MKIGIISDIHAELAPLKQAMALFQQHDVDTVVCAGDLVDGGMDEEAVVDFIRHRGIPTVQGNHDRDNFLDQAWLRRQQRALPDAIDDEDLMDSYRVAYLSGLPLTLHFEWEGVRVCLAHGTPWDNNQYVFTGANEKLLRRLLEEAQAEVLILGHTHTPMHITLNAGHIVNPGSLYGNRPDLKRTCGILTLPEVRFQVFDVGDGRVVEPELRRVR